MNLTRFEHSTLAESLTHEGENARRTGRWVSCTGSKASRRPVLESRSAPPTTRAEHKNAAKRP